MDTKNKSNNKYIGLVRNTGEILIPLVIYYITYLLSYIILTVLVIEIMQLDRYIFGNETTTRTILGGISMLIGILPLLSSLKREMDERQKQDIHAGNTKDLENIKVIKDIPLYKSALITITLAITSSVAINILFIWLRLTESSETYSRVAEHQYGVSLITGLIMYGIISPLAEEVVFRGVIYNRIKRNCSITAAVFLSALLFGLYHGNIVQGVYGFLMGILISYTYEWYGRFFHAFLFHAAANTAVYIITSNEAIFHIMITPHICLIFILIFVILIWRMKKMK
ncbi:MAG: CPBP family intramembrane metalloprotease [Lachnospiraceae bacterium]|nr:CPBP family intramembrane metalloprotease [Lachnospiraceae bacterium]